MLYLAVNEKCLRIEPREGERREPFDVRRAVADGARHWGYVAVVGDVLGGSSARRAARGW